MLICNVIAKYTDIDLAGITHDTEQAQAVRSGDKRYEKKENRTDISWDAGCIAGECIDDPTGAQLLGL